MIKAKKETLLLEPTEYKFENHGVFSPGNEEYKRKIEVAFSWFHGNNHLHQIIYNPVTGGCQDGLEENNVNFNQGAESTICYLLARIILEKHTSEEKGTTVKELTYELINSESNKLQTL